MIKMYAKFKGICYLSGATINVGDEVYYNTATRKCCLVPDDDTMYVSYK